VTKRVLATMLVAGVYLLMLASIDPVDVAIGVVVGALLVLGLAEVLFAGGDVGAGDLARRSARFVPFVAAVVWDIVRGTWDVALVVLHVRPLERPGIVAVPVGRRTRTGVAVSALVATLSPGEFLVDVDWERGLMYLHVLDATDPDGVRERHDAFYRRWQEPVFP
jgi:multisubunit Na+/H+ antiporter MnhE subunit